MAQGTPVKHRKKTKSVLKNIRQAESRAAINRMNRTRVRGTMRRMRAALSAGNIAEAEKLAPGTFSELDKSIRKRTLSENTANRYKSRLTLALNTLKAKKTKG
jgi:small subunit ribosomal protein S20